MMQVHHEKPVVLDCSGEALAEVLKGDVKPSLIKPNAEELAGLLGCSISTNVDDLKIRCQMQCFQVSNGLLFR